MTFYIFNLNYLLFSLYDAYNCQLNCVPHVPPRDGLMQLRCNFWRCLQ